MIGTRVTLSSDAAGRGLLSVDGHDISRAVRGVSIRIEAGSRPVVEIELAAVLVEVAELENPKIVVSDDVWAALVHLGWTPPAGEVMA